VWNNRSGGLFQKFVGSGGASVFDNNDVCVGFDEQQQIRRAV